MHTFSAQTNDTNRYVICEHSNGKFVTRTVVLLFELTTELSECPIYHSSTHVLNIFVTLVLVEKYSITYWPICDNSPQGLIFFNCHTKNVVLKMLVQTEHM